MDTKKVLVLESIVAALHINPDELKDWANNRKHTQMLAAKTSLSDVIANIGVLVDAAYTLAKEAEKADAPQETWCGH